MTGMSATAAASTKRGLRRQRDDFYRTPASATAALLKVERFTTDIWEPACGDGAMSTVLADHGYNVISSDMVWRGFGLHGRNFLFERELLARSVVTNPPFKEADAFVLHALFLGATHVAMFMRTAWLEGRQRYKTLWLPHPPIRVWQFSSRQTLWRGDDQNSRDTGGAISFAWFVWERGYRGAPALGWLP